MEANRRERAAKLADQTMREKLRRERVGGCGEGQPEQSLERETQERERGWGLRRVVCKRDEMGKGEDEGFKRRRHLTHAF